MSMGVGGLLMEFRAGRRRAERTTPVAIAIGRAPAIAGIVLAAGLGTRMGLQNKLLVNVGGRPLIAAAVEGAVASGLAPWWSSSAISAMQCAALERLARHYRREYELPGRPERFDPVRLSPPCRPVLMAWLLWGICAGSAKPHTFAGFRLRS